MTQAANLTDGVPQVAPFATADVAALLLALTTCHRGSARPDVLTGAPSGQQDGFWIETVSSTEWNWYYYDGTDDILVGTIDPTAHTLTLASGGGSGDLSGDQGAITDVASASTCDVLGAATWRVRVTGSTGPITSFGSAANRVRLVTFASTPTIAHNATSQILPTGANITAEADDTALIWSDGSGNVRVMYQRASGMPLAGVLRYDAAQGLSSGQKLQAQENVGLPSLLRGLISGLGSTWVSGTEIRFAAGAVPDDTFAVILNLAAAMTKTMSSWSAGDGGGGKLEAAAIANNTWYYWFPFAKADRTTDIGFSTSFASPTLPTGGYTYKKPIWATKTNGSGQWCKYVQIGDKCKWDQWFTEVANVNVTTTNANDFTLIGAPPIAGVEASGPCYLQSLATGGNLYVRSQDQTNTTTTLQGANAANVATPNSTITLRSSGWWSIFPSATGGASYRVGTRDGDTYAMIHTSEFVFPRKN